MRSARLILFLLCFAPSAWAEMNTDLIMVLKTPGTSAAKRIDAVERLGKVHSVEAIPILKEQLNTIRFQWKSGRRNAPVIGSYACAWALVDIGEPSIKTMLELARNSDDDLSLVLATYIIKNIVGEAKCVQMFKEAIKKEPQPELKTRLKRALFLVENQLDAIQIVHVANEAPSRGITP